MMNKNFYEAVEGRRSVYGISKEKVLSNEEIEKLITHAMKHTPSAMNSQSTRIVLLLGDKHDRLWDITMENLRAIVPAENFEPTETKINSFKSGYGTVLFFEDQSVVTGLQEKFSLYKDNFPIWSQHTSAMHQYVIWTGLEMEGYGASLQHYGEVIEASVKKEWEIPQNWKLIAQMPFGKPTVIPGEKEAQPLEARFKVIK